MGTESHQATPEPTPPTTSPMLQPRTAGHPASGAPAGEAAPSGMEERAIVRGARADSTYVRTRMPPLSHVHQVEDAGIAATKASGAQSPTVRLRRLLLSSRRHIPPQWRGWLKQTVQSLGRSSHARALLVVAGMLMAALILIRFGREAAWVVAVLALVFVVTGIGDLANHSARERKAAEMSSSPRMEASRHIVIVPLGSLNRPALRCLTYACSITPEVREVRAVYVAMEAGGEVAMRADWRDWVAAHCPLGERVAVDAQATANGLAEDPQNPPTVAPAPHPRLVVIESPARRAVLPPLLAYIATIREHNLDATVTVILPEYVPAHWWEHVLTDWTVYRLRLALHQIPQVVVTCVPYSAPR